MNVPYINFEGVNIHCTGLDMILVHISILTEAQITCLGGDGTFQVIYLRSFQLKFVVWESFKQFPSYPLSDRQLEKLRAVFGRGVKKRNWRRLAGNPADSVNTLAGEFWVPLGMVW